MAGRKKDIGERSQTKNDEDDKKLSDTGEGRGPAPGTPGKYEESHFVDTSKPVWNYSVLSAEDVENFQQGTHYRLYEKFGAHSMQINGTWGMYFCVWAPNATLVTVKGNFNDWNDHTHPLHPRWDKSGIWEGFIPHF